MQVRCIKAFGTSVPGDLAEAPDGASVDPEHWEAVQAAPEPAADPPEPAAAFPVAANQEGM